jgi:hypothetical protein
MIIMCGCGGLGPFLVGEQTSFWIGVIIWILHLGHNNEVVVEGIVGPHKGLQSSVMAHLASLCGTSQQMVMVTKVIREDTMVFFRDKVEKPTKITTLDEACVPPSPNKTYILWSTPLLVEKQS